MRKLITPLIGAMLAGCGSGEPTVEVSVAPSGMYRGQFIINVAALADQVTITKLNVNRGNCRPTTFTLPKKLGFGQTADAYIMNCNIKEVEVVTEDDAFSFSFD